MSDRKLAIVAGVGPGLSSSIVGAFAAAGYKVGGLARREESLSALEDALGADKFMGVKTDLSKLDDVQGSVVRLEEKFGPTSVYVHNATGFLMKPFLDTTETEFEDVWRSAVLTAFNGGQAVLPGMVSRGEGAFLITGATAALRGGADFSAFASAKFALRGLAQSLARAFGPKGVHVAHVVIDGIIWGASSKRFGISRDKCMEPDDIAQTFLDLAHQPKSCWTHELDIRPSVEDF